MGPEVGNVFWNSPSDNTTLNISNALKTADEEINFALLVFTNNQLGNTIAESFQNDIEINVFPIHEYWLDVGRIDDFNKAKEEIANDDQ